VENVWTQSGQLFLDPIAKIPQDGTFIVPSDGWVRSITSRLHQDLRRPGNSLQGHKVDPVVLTYAYDAAEPSASPVASQNGRDTFTSKPNLIHDSGPPIPPAGAIVST